MIYFIFVILVFFIAYEYRRLKSIDVNLREFLLKPPSIADGIVWSAFVVGCIFFAEEKIETSILAVCTACLFVYNQQRSRLFHFLNRKDDDAAWGLFAENTRVDLLYAPQVLLSDATSVLMVWFFIMVVFSFCLRFLSVIIPTWDSEAWKILLSTIVSSVMMLWLVERAVRKYSYEGFAHGVALVKKGISVFKLFILPVVIALFIAFISAQVIVSRPIAPQTPISEIFSEANSMLLAGVFIFMAVIVTPFIEEVVFRGYFFHVLCAAKSRRFAFYVVALSFSVLHFYQYWGDWLAIVIVTILGFVLTLLRATTHSTLASIMLHYAYNGGVTIFATILLVSANPSFAEYQANFTQLNNDRKLELIEQSLQAQPHWPQVLHQAAELYHVVYQDDAQKLQQALVFIEEAIAVDEHSAEYKETKSRILKSLKGIK